MSNAGGIVEQPCREVIHRRWMQLKIPRRPRPRGLCLTEIYARPGKAQLQIQVSRAPSIGNANAR